VPLRQRELEMQMGAAGARLRILEVPGTIVAAPVANQKCRERCAELLSRAPGLSPHSFASLLNGESVILVA
jgi:hypothetical protein